MLLLLTILSIASTVFAAPAQLLYLSPVGQVLGYQPTPVFQPFYFARAVPQECAGSDFQCLFNQNLNQSITQIQQQGQQGFDQLSDAASQGFGGISQGFEQITDGAQNWAPGSQKTPASTIEMKPIELERKDAMPAARIYTVAGFPQFFGNYEFLQNPYNPIFSLQPLQALKVGRSLVEPNPIKNDKFLAQIVPNLAAAPIPIVPAQPIAEPLKALLSEDSAAIPVQPQPQQQVFAEPLAPEPVFQSRSQDVQSNDNAIKDEPTLKKTEESVAQAAPVADAIAGKDGLAQASPVATAIVGKDGLAITRPEANAVAGDFKGAEEEKKNIAEKSES